MTLLFKRIGVIASLKKRKAIKLAEEVADYLMKKGLEVFLEDKLANKTKVEYNWLPLNKMDTDMIITIGGDGTILKTSTSIQKKDPIIFAVCSLALFTAFFVTFPYA